MVHYFCRKCGSFAPIGSTPDEELRNNKQIYNMDSSWSTLLLRLNSRLKQFFFIFIFQFWKEWYLLQSLFHHLWTAKSVFETIPYLLQTQCGVVRISSSISAWFDEFCLSHSLRVAQTRVSLFVWEMVRRENTILRMLMHFDCMTNIHCSPTLIQEFLSQGPWIS